MQIITSPSEMQREAIRWRGKGKKIALVPTMGALHVGHLSLIKRVRASADVVVMSIYVNPTQFGPKEDFSRYPRPRARDLQLARDAGVDCVFAPRELYREDHSTFVEETELSQGRCGPFRPGHFRGVATVVLKLFNLVQPQVAVFGQKDAQQCDVIERMVRDLNVPVKIVRAPLLRDKNGLALSSRNAYLSPEEYQVALELPKALKRAVDRKKLSPKVRRQLAWNELQEKKDLKVEYVEFCPPFLCAAVRVGKTRLIDNVRLGQ
jgi:pantoate--beta-alanine ligase